MICSPPILFQESSALLASVPKQAVYALYSYMLMIAEIEGAFIPFDGTACNITVTGGGGYTFECYDVGAMTSFSGKNGGTGFSGVWIMGDSNSQFDFGDDLDSYPAGAPGTLNSGTGFTAQWRYP